MLRFGLDMVCATAVTAEEAAVAINYGHRQSIRPLQTSWRSFSRHVVWYL